MIPMRKLCFGLIALTAGLVQMQCAAARLASMDQRLLNDADSLFSTGDYINARLAYTRIQSSYPSTQAAEVAQYMLGFLNIHHNNAFGDKEAAIREFSRYQTLYPQGRRIDEVNCWLHLLHSLQSYERGYSESTNRAEELASKQMLDQKSQTQLVNAIVKCDNMRDSLKAEIEFLKRKIKDHEEFMVKQLQ